MINFKGFSLLCWNVRGFANCKSHSHLYEILVRFKSDFIFLNESYTQLVSTKKLWKKEGYSIVHVMEVDVHSGGTYSVLPLILVCMLFNFVLLKILEKIFVCAFI